MKRNHEKRRLSGQYLSLEFLDCVEIGTLLLAIPVTARSNVCVCGRLIAGIAGSNPSCLL